MFPSPLDVGSSLLRFVMQRACVNTLSLACVSSAKIKSLGRRMYKKLYESRTTHVKNLKQVIIEHIERLSGLVKMGAEIGVTEIDSKLILEANSTLLVSLKQENERFEQEMTLILNPKGQSHAIASSRRTS